MNPGIILGFIGIYFGVLLLIAWITGRKADNATFFLGNKKSHWYLVALGMIGDSLSGVTFISVPGAVKNSGFGYLQVVFGYFLGYIAITYLLLPLYYRLNLTSIYSYLRTRFGHYSQKTGSFFFLLSRLLGAAGRLYLAVGVLQIFVFNALGVPISATILVIITLMVLYTYRGGIRTLVWTDSFQSLLLLSGLILSIVAIGIQLDTGFFGLLKKAWTSEYSGVFSWNFDSRNYFFKNLIGGAFIAISMTGLDQNMMQKNLSCPSIKDAQRNIQWFSVVMVLVNVLFVSLGALLYLYSEELGISLPVHPETGKIETDTVFPMLALNHLGLVAGLAFIVGLTAATFSSADSVLATLTTSFCIDFLGFERKPEISEAQKIRTRKTVQVCFAILLYLVIMMFDAWNNQAIIETILMIATYTYGPLLGLFAFGLFSKRPVWDSSVPFICIAAPVTSYLINRYSSDLLGTYQFGYELILVNAMIAYCGLLLFSRKHAESGS
jgi:SSS family transporter